MAALKGLFAVSAAALAFWRFGLPISARAALGYIACVWLLFAASAFIWQFAFIAAAAVLFHVGGLGALVIAWREGSRMPHSGRLAPNPFIERTEGYRHAKIQRLMPLWARFLRTRR